MGQIRVSVVVGSLSERSRTKVLAGHIVAALARALPARFRVLEVHHLVPQLLLAAQSGSEVPAAIGDIEAADLVVAVTPVYQGSYTGLFKHVFDLVAPEALVGTPVRLAANGGSDRHALMVDHQLRPLFAFFRALPVPSAVHAAQADFDGHTLTRPALQARLDEAVGQAVALGRSRTSRLAASADGSRAVLSASRVRAAHCHASHRPLHQQLRIASFRSAAPVVMVPMPSRFAPWRCLLASAPPAVRRIRGPGVGDAAGRHGPADPFSSSHDLSHAPPPARHMEFFR